MCCLTDSLPTSVLFFFFLMQFLSKNNLEQRLLLGIQLLGIQFQDAIISSLQEYNQHIDSLKDEMEEATQSAEEIRREIQSFRNK